MSAPKVLSPLADDSPTLRAEHRRLLDQADRLEREAAELRRRATELQRRIRGARIFAPGEGHA